MRTFDEIEKTARPGRAFSNGTQWEIWSHNWCERCIHDKPAREDRYEDACPLIVFAMTMDMTPGEWMAADEKAELYADYTCIDFRDEDDGPGPEPQPISDPPDQEVLWPREPFEGVRMLTEWPQEVGVPA